jgi:hypothetical protein
MLTPYVSDEVHERVSAYCAATGTTISQFTETALRELLDQSSDRRLLLKRLGRIERKLGKLDRLHQRDMGILFELFGGFVLNWMAHSPEIHGPQRDAAKRSAQRRLDEFEEYVARQVRGSKRFLRDLVEEPVGSEDALEEAATSPLDAAEPAADRRA